MPLHHSIGLLLSEWLLLIDCDKMATLHEDLCTSMIISHPVFLRMRNVLNRFVEKMKTQVCVKNFFHEIHAVYEIVWESSIEP